MAKTSSDKGRKVEINRDIRGCGRYVRGGACALPAGHSGSCVGGR